MSKNKPKRNKKYTPSAKKPGLPSKEIILDPPSRVGEREIKYYTPKGDPTKQTCTMCLVMIVKDEEDTIKRCLTAVAPYISYWVIVDTGSKDNTLQVIRETMSELGIEGELHERPWVNFEVNRTESLELAKGKCDFRWIIDADDTFVLDDPKINPFYVLDKEFDAYHISYSLHNLKYFRAQIVRSDEDWVYKGVLHEYLHLDKPNQKSGQIIGCHVDADISPLKRAGSVQEKYAKDAEILREALEKEPENTRYMFYLAQSYRDSNQAEKSLEVYQKRVEAGGWPEEVYYSMYMIARLKEALRHPINEVIEAYSRAWEFRPERLEAVFHVMRKLREEKRWVLALAYGESALQRTATSDILFVEPEIWQWRLLDEFSICSFYAGKVESAREKLLAVINSPFFKGLPQSEKDRMMKNLENFEGVITSNKQMAKK
jgi:glycosyltransferase involved in cell wall biosynthesis